MSSRSVRSKVLRSVVALGAVLTTLSLGACNTVSGAGQDVSAIGHGVSNGASSVANHM